MVDGELLSVIEIILVELCSISSPGGCVVLRVCKDKRLHVCDRARAC